MHKHLFLVLCVFSAEVAAEGDDYLDEKNRYMDMRCAYSGSGSGSVTIARQPLALLPKDSPKVQIFKGELNQYQVYDSRLRVGDVTECIYPSGNRVRLKVGEGAARGYGMCGGDPEVFLSLWVNQKKIESKLWFRGHCMPEGDEYKFTISRIDTDPSVEKCHSVEYPLINKPLGQNEAPKAEACVSFPGISNYPLDTDEYDNGMARVFDIGMHKIITGGEAVCVHVKDGLDKERGLEILKFKDVGKKVHEQMPIPSEVSVDIDNDGHDERVLKFDFYNNYMHSTQLMINLDSERQDADEQIMPPPGAWFLPCQFDSNIAEAYDCPPFSEKNDGGELVMGAEKEAVIFRGRYSILNPFLFEKKNYILVSSVSEDTMNYFAVIKLAQNRKYEKMCLIRREIENF